MTDTGAPPNGSPPDDPDATEEETQAANALRQALEGRRAGVHLPEPALETAALLRFSTQRGQLSHERQAALRAELLAALPASARPQTARQGLRRWLGLGVTLAGGATAVVVIGVIGARQLSAPAPREEAHLSDGRFVAATPAAPAAPAASSPTPSAPAPPVAAKRIMAANGEGESAKQESTAPATSAAAAAEPRPEFAAQGRRDRLASGAPGGGAALGRRLEARADDSEPALGAAAGRTAEAKKTKAPAQLPTEQVRRESDKYRSQLLAELADPRIDSAYGEADRAQSPEQLERAQQRLGALASGTFGGAKANAERLRPDIYCRLAEVALRLGQPQVALDWARRGIALGAPASPFVARLYLLEGQAQSALGDRDGAAKSYLKAIEVNEQLLDESLESP